MYSGRRTGITKVTFTPHSKLRADVQRAERQARIAAARAFARDTPNGWASVSNYGTRGRPSPTEVKAFDVVLGSPVTPVIIAPYATAVIVEPASWAGNSGLTCVNEIRQGTAFYERIGSKVQVKSVDCRFSIVQSNPATSSNEAGVIRCMLIYDRQCNGSFPAFTDIFSSANVAGVGYTNSGVNMTNRDRFVILADQMEQIDPGGSLSKAVKLFRNVRLETQYKLNGGTVGDIATGAIYFAIWAGTTISVSAYIADFSCRIRYYD